MGINNMNNNTINIEAIKHKLLDQKESFTGKNVNININDI